MYVNMILGACFLAEKFFGKKAGRNSPWMRGRKEGSVGQLIIPLFDMARIYAYLLTRVVTMEIG